MKFTKDLPGYGPLPAPLRRFLRKLGEFLYYDCFEFFVILIGVALILLVWEFSFWH